MSHNTFQPGDPVWYWAGGQAVYETTVLAPVELVPIDGVNVAVVMLAGFPNPVRLKHVLKPSEWYRGSVKPQPIEGAS